jgi:hypothetical protein
MKLKPVFRYDPHQHKLRLFRLLWTRGLVGDGKGGHSAKLAISFVAHAFGFQYDKHFGWRITVMGLQVHHLRSYGGTIV